MKRKTIYICSNCGYESPKWKMFRLRSLEHLSRGSGVVKRLGGKVVTARKKVAAKD